jgi:hypothetical protein
MANAGADDSKPRGGDRRGPDRRTGEAPFTGGDRRADQRRSGEDRREKARTRLTN